MAKEIGLSTETLKINLITGVGADTDLAVTGMVKDQSEIVSVWVIDTDYTAAGVTIADITSTCSITSDGNFQSSGATSNATVFCVWLNHDKIV